MFKFKQGDKVVYLGTDHSLREGINPRRYLIKNAIYTVDYIMHDDHIRFVENSAGYYVADDFEFASALTRTKNRINQSVTC